MKLITTIFFKKAKFSYLVSTFLILLISLNVTAHTVDSYAATCGAGPQYSVTANMSNNNSSSNYRWQWKNTSGSWICFVNGNNTINGNTYSVTGSVVNLSNLTTQTITITNPNSGLQGLEIRMVISDGSGVNPCTLPAGNTWTSTTNHFINVTGTSCASCTGRVTSLYFNELGGGADLPITNGSTFTVAQLASLYNLEAGASGTIGSVKFTITGPTATSNIENTAPYNSPGTASGAWTGAVGTYSVNLKTYNAADGGGVQCHDTTITFILTNTTFDCNCTGTNIVLNPGFESGISNWSFSGGTLAQGNGAVACGSFSGDLNNTSATSKAWQNIGTNLATGTVVNVSVYAGVHDNSFNNFVAVEFLNASNVVLGSSVYVQVDKVLANAPTGPQLYTFTATVPTGTTTTRVAFGGTGSWTKTDRWCVTSTSPPTGSIGDFVWNDGNGNGLQEASEPGLSGVQVQLLNTAGTVIATTTTNGVGFYQFTGLAAGTYTVKFLAVPGFGVSPANVGANDAIDSDVDGTGSVTVVLAAGQSNQTIDAGFCPTTLCIGNLVWNDVNNNGIKDATEVGISGATVNIYQDANNDNIADAASFATTTTSANGAYSFCNLVPGNYIIGVVTPAGFAKSTINGGDPDNNIDNDNNGINTIGAEVRGLSLTLSGGTEPDGTGSTTTDINNTYDFGFYALPTGSIGDRVWLDANANGIQDATETTPLTGVSVQLKNAAGTVIATTTTNATGNYLFSGLAAGNYTVVFPVSLSGAIVTTANVGADDNVDSDASQTTGETGTIVLGVGQNITNVDAGYCPTTLALGDRVYYDLNNNGTRDATETGIPSLTVNLYKDNNNDNVADGAAIATTTTDANGNYRFDNLVPGNYIVGATPPATYTSSSLTGVDPDNDIDLDDNGTNLVGAEWRGLAITLTGGGEPLETGNFNHTYDFGFYQPAILNLGNTVWYDQNNDGIKQATETGIVGATVNLYADANNDNVADGAAIASTTTIAGGAYSFANLAPGNYIVGVIIPTGYAVVTTNAGDPDNDTDNDNNGTNTSVAGEVRSGAVTLTTGGEPATAVDGDGTNGNLTVDFGFKGTASIGDFVFNDTNGNGIQDGTEVGIPNATVTLTYPNGTTVTTTTNASGIYSFTNLAPGTYSVAFTTPAGFTPTASNVGVNDAVDSDPIGGTVTGIVLTAGQVNNSVDAGFYQANLNLGNTVWYDQNNDGIKQATETGIVGATVNLYADANNDNVADGAAIATTTTIAGGAYGFANLAPGNYIVGVIIPTGYAVVTTNGGDPDNDTDNDNNGTNTSVAGEVRSSAVTLTTGGEPATAVDGDGTNGNLTVDFGFKGTASIGDFVFNDINGNGIQDAGELGIPSATVTLTYPNGSTATTTTNASGIYSFTNLAPGTYSVAFTTPAGFTPTGSNVGANDAVDSDPVSGTVTGIVLTAGQVNNTIDAGFFQANLNLGNNVWYDQNNDGIKQATETGIVGATVNLYADANNDNVADAAAIATTTTIAGGAYGFANLAPGNYIVGVIIPTGYAVVTTNGGDPDNDTDNDNNGTNTSVAGEVRSSAVTLTTGGEPATAVDGDGTNGNLTVDFGFKGTASIGDFVFNDTNGNGIQDAGELGIPNASVTLTYPNGATVTTTTNASGIYSFTNLAPGSYNVGFTTPVGYANVSPSNQGANDAIDSDPIGGVVTGIVLTAGQINNTVDAGFFNCVAITSGINGPTTICAAEAALFTATGAGSGSVYTWTFMSGTPATATGSSVTSSWSTPGEYDITLTVTKNGCTASYTRSIVITQSVFAGAGPDADICSGSSTTLNGTGPAGSNYSWTVVAGDPTSIDNGASQQNVLVSPLVTTTYLLTVTQNGCTRTDQVTVFINVNKNPIADAGPNRTTLIGTPVAIGGSPTGTAPLATPGVALGYIWSPATGLNSNTLSNPTATLTVPGVYNYQVIVYSILTGCSDTAVMSVTAIQPVNVGNHVWYDKNNNGIKEVGEPGVATTVRLYKDDNNDNIADGAAIATTTTVNGVYNFGNLYPGNYIVGAVIPNGFLVVTTNGGDPDNNVDNDNNGINTSVAGEVRSSSITLSAGGEPAIGTDGDDANGNLTLDIALTGLAQLGNFVWEDVNRNGIQDPTEPGILNVTVTITYPDGGTAISTTNDVGAYLFDKLMPGTYSVAFTTPNGYIPTTSNVTGGSATDANDSDPINGVVSNVILSAGQINNTIDAGFFRPINIYGNVWHDANALIDNQVNKTSLSPIPNALNVYLVDDATGIIIQAEGVLNDGTYSFLDVSINKSYRVVITSIVAGVGEAAPRAALPSGWRNTGENLGAGPNSGDDGVINGVLFIDTETSDIFNANFGIRIKNGEVIIG